MSEWVSVKDRLPSHNEMVLVYCPKEVTKIRACGFSDWDGAEGLGISHWMPLPNIPE